MHRLWRILSPVTGRDSSVSRPVVARILWSGSVGGVDASRAGRERTGGIPLCCSRRLQQCTCACDPLTRVSALGASERTLPGGLMIHLKRFLDVILARSEEL